MTIIKPWLSSYPPDVPHVIAEDRPASLPVMLELAFGRFREHPAFTHMGTTLRHADVDRLTRHFAGFLQSELGLAPGERVAVILPNCLQQPVAVLGALRAGLVVVNVNPQYTASEMAYQLRDAGATAAVVLENLAATLQRALPETAVQHVVVTQLGDLLARPGSWVVNGVIKHVRHAVPPWNLPQAWTLRRALAAGAHHPLRDPQLQPADLAFLQYTGGTTGRSRGAMLTHANLVANVEQTAAWLGRQLQAGAETVITALPLYHVFALTVNLLLMIRLGGHNVLITDPRDMARLIGVLQRTRFSVITGVNTLYAALLDAPGIAAVARHNAGALKLAVAGGMALDARVAQRWQQVFDRPLLQGYGLTEASPVVCCERTDEAGFTGTLGLPLPSTDVAIVDESLQPLPPGEAGEILVRGPQVMAGYWEAPQETAQALAPQGWLRTGDIGRLDGSGHVHFVDRLKDVIVVSGFKVVPAEVEEVVKAHPLVRDAGAVGVPDARTGESVALFVVPRDPALTADMLRTHCAEHLTGYKRPRLILLRDELPRTPIGKVLRRRLRDELLEAQQHRLAA